MKHLEFTRQSAKLIGICALVVFIVNIAGVPVAEGKIDEIKAAKTRIQSKNCIPEKGLEFEAGDETRLSTEEIDNLLTGNTILSTSEEWGYSQFIP